MDSKPYFSDLMKKFNRNGGVIKNSLERKDFLNFSANSVKKLFQFMKILAILLWLH